MFKLRRYVLFLVQVVKSWFYRRRALLVSRSHNNNMEPYIFSENIEMEVP